jgi:Na+-transporting NADH:ubiquinone oxidoreductase subunit A
LAEFENEHKNGNKLNMAQRIVIKKGLNLPIVGQPKQEIERAREVSRVGLIADDYRGMRPTMMVSEGDNVRTGQPLFEDKKTPGVLFTAPATGRVVSVMRGEKRRFLGLEIELSGKENPVQFTKHTRQGIGGLSREAIVEQIVQSGLWTALRTRPFSRVPSPTTEPHSLFVTAIDTNPLAVDPKLVIDGHKEHFEIGLLVLRKLTSGSVFVCTAPGSGVPGEGIEQVKVVEFEGPHPAGLPGTHMHFLDPVTAKKINWHIGYQDVIAIGKLFDTGVVVADRVISLAGPAISRPRLLQTRLGAKVSDLLQGEVSGSNNRIVAGSVLCGVKVEAPLEYLNRYALQLSVLEEGNKREFLGWQQPGFNKFSLTKAFAGCWDSAKRFAMTTSTEGSERAMVPIGTYERVMPLDLIPTLLLRALITRDTEKAQELGCLELDDEDLALCTYVCPGKYEYGEILRDNLLKIEKEG